jgi:hypothetical protein
MTRRAFRVAVAAGLVAALPACASNAVTPVVPPTISYSSSAFRLDAGVEHDVCGIGVVLVFIPADALSAKLDYPVLVGGPVGHVDAALGDRTGLDPLPDNAAHLTHGVVVRVDGNRFGVNDIDVAARSALLTPLCA